MKPAVLNILKTSIDELSPVVDELSDELSLVYVSSAHPSLPFLCSAWSMCPLLSLVYLSFAQPGLCVLCSANSTFPLLSLVYLFSVFCLQVTGMGPGKYESVDFIQLSANRPTSTRGICDTTGPKVDPVNRVRQPQPILTLYWFASLCLL